MVDAAAHTLEPYARIRPHAGITLDAGRLKTHLYAGVETENYEFKTREIWSGQVQYQMTGRSAFKIEASNEQAGRYLAGFNYFW